MERSALRPGFSIAPHPLLQTLSRDAGRASQVADALWRCDPAGWTTDSVVREKIANRLGWLTSPPLMAASLDRLRATADDVRQNGFTDVVLLGMGGSSLAPEVLRAVIGVAPGSPRLHMLDSTDPAAVNAVEHRAGAHALHPGEQVGHDDRAELAGRAFQVRARSGRHRQLGRAFRRDHRSGTELATLARNERFRDIFINPADIGGRYSALSFFGLVPAALMGQDVAAILNWGRAMLEEAQAPGEVATNPAVGLGLLMATAAKAGRDKLTLILPPSLEAFGLWVEQLVAESTGKHGVGIVPIAGETLGAPDKYREDRLFVRLRTTAEKDEAARDARRRASRRCAAGDDRLRGTGGARRGVHALGDRDRRGRRPARASIRSTNRTCSRPRTPRAACSIGTRSIDGCPPDRPTPPATTGSTLTLTTAARSRLGRHGADNILTLLGAGDYLALLAYLGPDPALGERAARVPHDGSRQDPRRHDVRLRPALPALDRPAAQGRTEQRRLRPDHGQRRRKTSPFPASRSPSARWNWRRRLGDFASLEATGRRAIHVHLPSPDPRALERTLARFTQALPRLASESDRHGTGICRSRTRWV